MAAITSPFCLKGIQEHCKYACQWLQDIMLTNTSPSAGTTARKKLLTLEQITGKLVRETQLAHECETDAQISAWLTTRYKMRMALVRMETMRVFKKPHDNRHHSQWNSIDRMFFYSLILQEDRCLFGQPLESTYAELINHEDFNMPSDVQIQDEIEAIQARIGQNHRGHN
ncbi:hypothetical protein CROQUDRAFT_90940 [Cronartium quercuum f. sp. fusiforme G11]|uniref:Uncharacterized protein n=1 Tax=Cronartium quercuum f. sp. fusiforme G11 TaxID=708437 RepID=A0A9P6TDK9_9BASI|nr:hypothetical protein CROQUDRAFT_90940 [Cronartium quercuum f. sp. fusiforme G11]